MIVFIILFMMKYWPTKNADIKETIRTDSLQVHQFGGRRNEGRKKERRKGGRDN